ncbi:MAG TPA: thioredoxin family protein [Thermoanaerobaculia bacterium]|jgi:suppressor for copper-sensitivity B|nr:thioredoxin family protein [Thermoanaerobaculia bacterium]
MTIRRARIHSVALIFCLALAGRAEAQLKAPQKATFVLNSDRTAYEAGAPARVAALVTIEHGWHVNSHKPSFEYLIPTVLDLTLPAGWPQETVQYPAAKMKTFSFEPKPLAVYDGDVVMLAAVQVPKGVKKGAYPVSASLRYQACNDTQCLPPVTAEARIELTVGPGGQAQHGELFATGGAAGGEAAVVPEATEAVETAPAKPAGSLGVMLLLALLGGLILNAMPCVLPVLSLKVFGLVRSAGHGRAEVVRGALATSAGILSSFLALALVAVVAHQAGAAVGWGVQFQHPGFVAFLAVVVVLFCLNLWGLFEIPLPQRLARLGGIGASTGVSTGGNTPREGIAGHFFSGLFATLMATPCSAPFLGTAIGFALAQPAPVVFAIFAALGLGMALPYLLIAAAPGVARLLPRPGAWMETVRGVMGFLLAAAAVWLFYVLSSQVAPEQLAAIQLGLLGIALFTWIQHRVANRRALRGMAGAGVIAAIAITMFAATGATAARGEARQGRQGLTASQPAGLIPWVQFDRARAESLARGGQLVFVDVTADWCFTCKVNERLVLDTPEVARAFEDHNVVPMRADWTNKNDEIGKFLAAHGRYGIPFYLLYRPGRPPHVFGELPSKSGLVATVRAAAGS